MVGENGSSSSDKEKGVITGVRAFAAVELVETSLQSCCHCFWWWAGELNMKWERPGTQQNKKTTEACNWLSSSVFHVVGNLQEKTMLFLIGLRMYPAQDLENWRSRSDSSWRSCGLEFCSMPTWCIWKSAEIPMCCPHTWYPMPTFHLPSLRLPLKSQAKPNQDNKVIPWDPQGIGSRTPQGYQNPWMLTSLNWPSVFLGLSFMDSINNRSSDA